MTEALPASSSAQPAAPSACEFCKQPLGGQFYRVANRVTCSSCAAQALLLRELNTFSAGAFFRGALFGLGAAIATGFVWAIVAKATGRELGLVAIGAGWLVSKAVLGGGGGRRGPALQTIAIALTVIGIWIGKGLIASWALWDQWVQAHPNEATTTIRVIMFFGAPFFRFSPYDPLFYALAIWRAWRMLHSFNVPLDGPFNVGADPSAPIPGLQFNTVQPMPYVMPPPLPPSLPPSPPPAVP